MLACRRSVTHGALPKGSWLSRSDVGADDITHCPPALIGHNKKARDLSATPQTVTRSLNKIKRRFCVICGFLRAPFAGITLLALSACSVAPIQEMSDARQAVQAARDVGAERFAPAQLQNAEGDIAEAEKLLGQGQDQFAAARSKAIAAKDAAIIAREITAAMSRAKQSLTQAEAAGLDTTAWQSTFDDASSAAQEGRHDEALDKARKLTVTVDAAIAAAIPSP